MEKTKEERENGIRIRDSYNQQIADFKKHIAYNQEIISKLSRENMDLELRICNAKPRLEGAEKFCEKCDIISMKYSHIVPGQGIREHWYKCIICGNENYHT